MSTDYLEKYKFLKRKLKILVYEHESLSSELEKSQHRLLKVSRDNSYLLDRLLQYEQVVIDSADDSDITISSDSDSEAPVPAKRRLIPSQAFAKAIKVQNHDDLSAMQKEEKSTKPNITVKHTVEAKTGDAEEKSPVDKKPVI